MRVFVDGNPHEVCCVADGKISRAPIDSTNTNNMAEYRAVLFGLYMHPEATKVCSDSQLVVRQLNGEYKISKEHLRKLAEKVHKQVEKLGHSVSFSWVSREGNPAGEVLG